jgi:hypothetical protein
MGIGRAKWFCDDFEALKKLKARVLDASRFAFTKDSSVSPGSKS